MNTLLYLLRMMFYAVIIVIVGGAIFFYTQQPGSQLGAPNLQVEIIGPTKEIIRVTNLSRLPVIIESATVNDKEVVHDFSRNFFTGQWVGDGCAGIIEAYDIKKIVLPQKLEFGETAHFGFLMRCGKIADITLRTDHGIHSYGGAQ